MNQNEKKCRHCGHDGQALDAGGYCNQLVLREGVGDTCGCLCTWDTVTALLEASAGEEIVDDRVSVYGDPIDTHIRIAQVWSGILGHEVNAVDVPLLMAGLKLVRTQITPTYADNSDDVEGYIEIFRQIVGPDMVHARTASDFRAQRAGR